MIDSVKFSIASAQYELDLSNVICMTETGWRKMLRHIKRYSWNDENTAALLCIRRSLPEVVEDYKTKWHDATVAYQNGYQLPPNHPLAPAYTYQQAKHINAENKRLIAAVKRAKKAYDKAVKFYDIFKEET